MFISASFTSYDSALYGEWPMWIIYTIFRDFNRVCFFSNSCFSIDENSWHEPSHFSHKYLIILVSWTCQQVSLMKKCAASHVHVHCAVRKINIFLKNIPNRWCFFPFFPKNISSSRFIHIGTVRWCTLVCYSHACGFFPWFQTKVQSLKIEENVEFIWQKPETTEFARFSESHWKSHPFKWMQLRCLPEICANAFSFIAWGKKTPNSKRICLFWLAQFFSVKCSSIFCRNFLFAYPRCSNELLWREQVQAHGIAFEIKIMNSTGD